MPPNILQVAGADSCVAGATSQVTGDITDTAGNTTHPLSTQTTTGEGGGAEGTDTNTLPQIQTKELDTPGVLTPPPPAWSSARLQVADTGCCVKRADFAVKVGKFYTPVNINHPQSTQLARRRGGGVQEH
jgi:hypothetical protein